MKPEIYNIPAGYGFAEALARGLREQTIKSPELLAKYLILLPTRRACRTLQDAFLKIADGTPLLLPRLQPIGDIDAQELFLLGLGAAEVDIPPAMADIKRQILLARHISLISDISKTPQQNMELAKALGQLMDQVHTENLDLRDLPKLAEDSEIAKHWEITVTFLKILSETWPQILEVNGEIDAADRRNRLINALNHHWRQNPPENPVIAAGTTGSIPATAQLLKTISLLPKGKIILPGLDSFMSPEAWNMVEEGHPQATIKKLLNELECTPQDVKPWPYLQDDENMIVRQKLISQVMTPAEKTDDWQNNFLSSSQKSAIKKSLENITRHDLKTAQDEALIIALLLRETLETEGKTAALVTPDRSLAQRVIAHCRRWNINIDDSGGQTLDTTPLGVFLLLCAQACLENFRPSTLLALLKHDLAGGKGFKNYRQAVRNFEIEVLRGKYTGKGFAGFKEIYRDKNNNPERTAKPKPSTLDLINHLEPIFEPLSVRMKEPKQSFSKLMEAHLQLAENLSSNGALDGGELLWTGDTGEATALFFAELFSHTAHFQTLSAEDYCTILKSLMQGKTIRSRYGAHPNLMILGQLEARIVHADRIIMAGLNEGKWPPDNGYDPWMSRQMRQNFGLPAPERSITLAAHDFVQGFCNKEVFLTRAEREDGTPTVAARWLERLDTYLQAVDIKPEILRKTQHLAILEQIDKVTDIKPCARPAPKPPIASRPDKLSVTKIEKWICDPYGIYADKILGLRKLDDLEKEIDDADKGDLLHQIMQVFTEKYKDNIPNGAKEDFIQIARDVFEKNNIDETAHDFWMPRLIKLAEGLIPHEQKWRKSARFIKAEAKGSLTLDDGLQRPFTLTTVADRIDFFNAEDSAAIIDYKSGSQWSVSKILSGESPQLPLEALILTEGGFHDSGVQKKEVSYLAYWKMGGKKGMPWEITAVKKDVSEAIETSKDGLLNLIRSYENQDTAYTAIPRLDLAPRYNDYAYLERIKEWAALDDPDIEEAA